MAADQPQNLDAQANPVSEPTGSDDEAIAAFERLGDPAENTEPDPADQAEDEPDTEAEEADPEADEPEDELVEVEAEGKTYKVPEAVQKAMLRQADYSRKMNEVSAKEKTLVERLETLDAVQGIAEKRAEALAEVHAIDQRIKGYEGIDWAKARAENPSEAALAAVELLALRDQRKEAAQAAANVARELTNKQQALHESARDEMDAQLKKSLRGWGDELGTQVTRYALESGVALKTLQQLTDPAVVVALDKARKFDALQSAKGALKAKAADAPRVVKPGSPRPKADARAAAMQRLQTENTQDAAEAAFLSRM